MFEAFYQLSNTPFARDIPTEELYQSRALIEALGRLEHTATRKLFTVVTGDCGVGKTTIIRKLKDTLDSLYRTMLQPRITNLHIKSATLAQASPFDQ
mgnify:CR=1 FL=1